MTDEPIPTTDHEYIAMVAVLAGSIAWPFFHPFHSTASTVIYWAGVTVALICASLLVAGAVMRKCSP